MARLLKLEYEDFFDDGERDSEAEEEEAEDKEFEPEEEEEDNEPEDTPEREYVEYPAVLDDEFARMLNRIGDRLAAQHNASRIEPGTLRAAADSLFRQGIVADIASRLVTVETRDSGEEEEGGEDPDEASDNQPYYMQPGDLERARQESAQVQEARKQAEEERQRATRAVEAERLKNKNEIEELRRRVAELENRPSLARDEEEEDTYDKSDGNKRRRRSPRLATHKPAAAAATKPSSNSEEKKPSTEDNPCPICCEPLSGAERGCLKPCGHSRFHYDCAFELYTNHGKCVFHNPGEKITGVDKIFV